MEKQKKYRIDVDIDGMRLDKFLSFSLPEFSRSLIQKSIKSDLVFINGQLAKSSSKISIGDAVECTIIQDMANDTIAPQNIPLNIIFEDADIIVVNKPSGLVVHPGNGHRDGTLANGLAYYCNKLSDVNQLRPGIVHRLDKETSGIMIIAKTNNAHAKLSKQFSDKTIKKTYYALAWGKPDDRGTIEGFISRDSRDRTKFKMSNGSGRSSLTKYYLEKHFAPISMLKLIPKTGRTHQLRVHLSSIGHPIFSDTHYSGGVKRIKSYHVKYTKILKRLFKYMDRVALHAQKIEFIHPVSNSEMSFSAPFPEDFLKALDVLENE